MAYTHRTLLNTVISGESAPVVIARIKRFLLWISIGGTATVSVLARQCEGPWHELATLTESAEFSLDNYGWQELCIRAEIADAQSAARIDLSWSEP